MSVTLATPLHQLVLSPGSAVTVTGLTWQHYQLLLAEFGENRASRLAYDTGVLEIRMPSQLHRQGQITIVQLQAAGFVESDRSLAFPGLSPEQLQTWLAQRETETDVAVIRAVRQFCQSQS